MKYCVHNPSVNEETLKGAGASGAICYLLFDFCYISVHLGIYLLPSGVSIAS